VVSAGSDGTVRVWDAETWRQIGPQTHYLPEGEFAVLAADGSRAIGVTDGAWRWLGWQVRDEKTGELKRYPSEIRGPLPALKMPA
jgi:WD40 repeat protein